MSEGRLWSSSLNRTYDLLRRRSWDWYHGSYLPQSLRSATTVLRSATIVLRSAKIVLRLATIVLQSATIVLRRSCPQHMSLHMSAYEPMHLSAQRPVYVSITCLLCKSSSWHDVGTSRHGPHKAKM